MTASDLTTAGAGEGGGGALLLRYSQSITDGLLNDYLERDLHRLDGHGASSRQNVGLCFVPSSLVASRVYEVVPSRRRAVLASIRE